MLLVHSTLRYSYNVMKTQQVLELVIHSYLHVHILVLIRFIQFLIFILSSKKIKAPI